MSIRILLVDDHHLVREKLRQLLEQEEDFTVVGEAENGRVAVERSQELSPDVILMDVSMPEMDGIEAAGRITQTDRQTRILILSMYSDPDLLRRALAMGASGYLLKNCGSDEPVRAIRAVLTGKNYITPLLVSC
jgi:DNA-binding NarL/FixJ family response regulator